MDRSQRGVRSLLSLATIAAGLLWLHVSGTGNLGAPPLSLPGAAAWLDQRDTTTAAFALLRLVALGMGGYLLLVTAISGGARYLRLPRVATVADRVTLPCVRGLLGGMTMLGVTAAPPPTPPPTDSMIELSSDPTATTAVQAPAASEQATLRLLPDPPATPAVPAPPPEPVAPSAEANTWIVQPGESFWSIAAEHLGDSRGHSVSEREVASYWREVIELNRSRLVNPDDANLLFAGQVLELPPVGAG